MSIGVDQLLRKTSLWRAADIGSSPVRAVPSGFPHLDCHLPGGGWPTAGVAELLHEQCGVGELRLAAPTLALLSREVGRWLMMVQPPYLPYAPALVQAGIDIANILIVRPREASDYLWVIEQALASKGCSAVLAWPRVITAKQVRRLQLASKSGNCLGLLFRPAAVAAEPSPAELRLRVREVTPSPFSASSAVEVSVLKRRGGWETGFMRIDFDDHLNLTEPNFSEMVIANPAQARPVDMRPARSERFTAHAGRS